MTAVPLRTRQYVVSTIGALFFLPVYLFLGGLFSLSYSISDSAWAWGFGLVGCWAQIMAVLASFFNPRKAAWCMIANTVIGIVLAYGHMLRSGSGDSYSPIQFEIWLRSGPGVIRAISVFWAPPLMFAFLLLWQVRAAKKRVLGDAIADSMRR